VLAPISAQLLGIKVSGSAPFWPFWAKAGSFGSWVKKV
jgi:hypothetical protein